MNREDFLNQVETLLIDMGFVKNENNFQKNSQVQGQTQQIIINGQKMV